MQKQMYNEIENVLNFFVCHLQRSAVYRGHDSSRIRLDIYFSYYDYNIIVITIKWALIEKKMSIAISKLRSQMKEGMCEWKKWTNDEMVASRKSMTLGC